ncbi:hypothetical protein SH501x_000360 [Pirellulaceae bacterium SH501]
MSIKRALARTDRHFTVVAFLIFLCIGAAGCNGGPKIAPARGVVVFEDGTPVKVGTVETKHTELEGVQARGSIQEDGTFVLGTFSEADGAAVGKHRCVVVQFVMVEDVPGFKPSTQGVVNPAHASYATSGLTIDIPEEGTDELKLVVRGVQSRGGNKRGHGEHQELPEGTVPGTP